MLHRVWQFYKNYISYRIPHKYEAEDLTQEVFIRLLDYKQFINPETIKPFLLTIARNLITDNIRLYYKIENYTSKIYETIKSGIENTEQTILANELAALINSRMKHLPDKRRTTYHLSLYDGLSVSEIAERLHISYRTAECHLFLARKDMRHFITYFGHVKKTGSNSLYKILTIKIVHNLLINVIDTL